MHVYLVPCLLCVCISFAFFFVILQFTSDSEIRCSINVHRLLTRVVFVPHFLQVSLRLHFNTALMFHSNVCSCVDRRPTKLNSCTTSTQSSKNRCSIVARFLHIDWFSNVHHVFMRLHLFTS